MNALSFSRQVKDEILPIDMTDEDQNLWIAVVFVSLATFRGKEISLKNANFPFMEKFLSVAETSWFVHGTIDPMKAHAHVVFQDLEDVSIIREQLEVILGFNSLRGTLHKTARDFSADAHSVILRALYLATGSMAEPKKSYQVEFVIRRQHLANFAEDVLAARGIEVSRQKNGAYQMLYIKNGDHVATFLALIGAYKAYLSFEDIRIRKSMNGMVNRAVNCDNANSQRVAETAARQLDMLSRLEEEGGFDQLPEDLQQAARIRLDYPGYSIRELGELMDPPLGKSGMYHRLGRLEEFAKQYFAEKSK